MATLLDYIKTNGHRDYHSLALNELDVAVINEIGYLTFDELVADDNHLEATIKLSQLPLLQTREIKGTPYDFLNTKERLDLFQMMCQSKRFSELTLSHYINDINTEFEKQFAAMVFRLPSIDYTQLVFRGTDDSLIGWKEDFKLTYMREIPAHRSAIDYLKTYHTYYPNQKLVLSGHSKGGNLALYAASFVPKNVQASLKDIYLFDSPGLIKEFLTHPGYQAIRRRLVVIKPQDAIIGVMLYCDVPEKIVQSQSYGLLQHQMVNWQITPNTQFKRAPKRSALSYDLEETFKDWTNQLSKQDLKLLCDTFFDCLASSGITSLNAFSLDDKAFLTLMRVISSLQSIDHEKKKVMVKSLHQLMVTYGSYRRRDISENIHNRLQQLLTLTKGIK
ncbi:Mbeg1-like protein [Streptococcus dysgalactiae]|uniref:Mbeg1-like protein n=1 Tax=Streptococcus dysgalactiae TaxID=1334 RepID=UPI0034A3F569